MQVDFEREFLSHHLSFCFGNFQEPSWLIISLSTQTLQHRISVFPKASLPSPPPTYPPSPATRLQHRAHKCALHFSTCLIPDVPPPGLYCLSLIKLSVHTCIPRSHSSVFSPCLNQLSWILSLFKSSVSHKFPGLCLLDK